MFKIRDRAITPRKALFENALKRLPAAHLAAQEAGVSHLHQQMTSAAEDAGINSGPLVVARHKTHLYVGIEYGEAGDRLADVEFGRPESAPNPVLRTAATQAHPEASRRYQKTLRREMGF